MSSVDDLDCIDFPVAATISTIHGGISVIVLLYVTISFTRTYQHVTTEREESAYPIASRNVTTTLVGVVTIILSCLSMFASIIPCLGNVPGVLHYYATLLQGSVWLVSGILILITFILRLQLVFQGSVFQFRTRTFGLLLFVLVIILACGCAAVAMLVFDQYMSFLLGAGVLLMYLCCALVTLFLFVCTLYNVQVTSMSTSTFGGVAGVIGLDLHATGSGVTSHQMEVIEVISKYSVLVVTSLVVTFVCGVMLLIRGTNLESLQNRADEYRNLVLYFIHFNLVMLDSVVNALCLMLQYHFFGVKFYQNLCVTCCKCHVICTDVIKAQTIKAMEEARTIEVAPTRAMHAQMDGKTKVAEDSVATPSAVGGSLKIVSRSDSPDPIVAMVPPVASVPETRRLS